MTEKEFIEGAIAGGWKIDYLKHVDGAGYLMIEAVLLDPLAWSAVGKTRGWYINTKCREDHSLNYKGTCMMFAWHHFIDHLADGLSIDDALTAIS